ncbi:mucin-5AC-like [Xyrauchen texanus]|uniref:mucin-5AC-like n=1 Tax=Xyrauchen texanus TaxID=154827 RepID=UPI002241C4F8|nr:mucin-5AC-like [Xyrauchen texanus]
MDITIQRGNSLPEIQKCHKCCSDFHCPFCDPIYFKPTKLSKVQKHLKGHFNRAVQHEGYTIHRCGRPCRTQHHYHCLYCQSTILRKPDFITHLGSCKCKRVKRASATDACNITPTAVAQATAIAVPATTVIAATSVPSIIVPPTVMPPFSAISVPPTAAPSTTATAATSVPTSTMPPTAATSVPTSTMPPTAATPVPTSTMPPTAATSATETVDCVTLSDHQMSPFLNHSLLLVKRLIRGGRPAVPHLHQRHGHLCSATEQDGGRRAAGHLYFLSHSHFSGEVKSRTDADQLKDPL